MEEKIISQNEENTEVLLDGKTDGVAQTAAIENEAVATDIEKAETAITETVSAKAENVEVENEAAATDIEKAETAITETVTAKAENVEVEDEAEGMEDTEAPLDKNIKLMSPMQMVIRRFFRSKLSIIGLIMIVSLFVFSFTV